MTKRCNRIIRTETAAKFVVFFTGLIPKLNKKGYEVVSVSSDGPELERVRETGGRAVTVEMARHISLWQDLRSLWNMIRVFHREKPMMVHSMTPKAGLLSMIAGKLTGVPVRVHTFTGLVFPTSTGLKRRILMATDWLTCACATHVIPEGEGVKADLLNNGITKKKLQVLGYGNCRGIDLERFSQNAPGVREEAEKLRKVDVFTFVFIGRLVGDKGINELIEAFVKLHEEFPDTRLLLVGGKEQDLDPLKTETLKTINEHTGIEAVGVQKDVRPWLLASDVFVLPSYREGFPNVVIEAGAMGKPSIVTDINGSREIIVEGRNGTIVPPRDSEALLHAMRRMVTNPQRTKAMADEARPMIASRFEQSFVQACLLDYYDQIIRRVKY